MLLDFFNYNDAVSFTKMYDFKNIEPFTLLIICTTDELCFYELKWDGEKTYLSHVDEDKPNIWSSATLYSEETISQRKIWFTDFLKHHPQFSMDDILKFHKFGGNEDIETKLLMNKNDKVLTLSTTMVHRTPENLYMHHINTITDKSESIRVIR